MGIECYGNFKIQEFINSDNIKKTVDVRIRVARPNDLSFYDTYYGNTPLYDLSNYDLGGGCSQDLVEDSWRFSDTREKPNEVLSFCLPSSAKRSTGAIDYFSPFSDASALIQKNGKIFLEKRYTLDDGSTSNWIPDRVHYICDIKSDNDGFEICVTATSPLTLLQVTFDKIGDTPFAVDNMLDFVEGIFSTFIGNSLRLCIPDDCRSILENYPVSPSPQFNFGANKSIYDILTKLLVIA